MPGPKFDVHSRDPNKILDVHEVRDGLLGALRIGG